MDSTKKWGKKDIANKFTIDQTDLGMEINYFWGKTGRGYFIHLVASFCKILCQIQIFQIIEAQQAFTHCFFLGDALGGTKSKGT